jgi:hypothetical protein
MSNDYRELSDQENITHAVEYYGQIYNGFFRGVRSLEEVKEAKKLMLDMIHGVYTHNE